MANIICSIDTETYSPYELSDCGVYRYVESPEFQLLLLGYRFDDENDVRVIDLASGERVEDHKRLYSALCGGNPEHVMFTAWNANFERQVLRVALRHEMPPEQWDDTMVRALELGLPGSLAGAGIALGLPAEKLKDPRGKALINYFSKPCKPTKSNGMRTRNLPAHDPDKWKLYIEYNRQDVVTEQAIREMLLKKVQPIQSEWDLWYLDQRMNDRGVRVDLPMVQKIVRYDEQRQIQLINEAKDITGLENPNSLIQLKDWLTRKGVPLAEVTKDVVVDQLKKVDLPPEVRRVLEIRQALGKSSVKKFHTMLDAACADGRIRGTMQFYGAARTGRFAGRLVQVHNLSKNYLPDLDLARQLVCENRFDDLEMLFGEPAFVFSELVRTAFIPSKDRHFIVADFSAIEARVLGWLAGEEWVLDAFRNGKDIYCETASKMYHVPVVKHGQNGHLRQKGKVAVLACGYQGGVGAMKRMDKEGSIPEEELQSVVDQWRSANPHIVKFWRDCEDAAKTAIREKRSVRRGIRLQIDPEEIRVREYAAQSWVRPYSVRENCSILFTYRDKNLYIKLPSGRSICYWDARLKKDPTGKEYIAFWSVNTARQWAEEETYSGKLVENLTQAVARDCLAETIRNVSAMGYEIVMHVHDEIIVDVPVSDINAYQNILETMKAPIPWAPGLPLNADGYVCDYYRKD